MTSINYWAKNEKECYATLKELSIELDKSKYKRREIRNTKTIYEYDCGRIILRGMDEECSTLLKISFKGLLRETRRVNRKTLRNMVDSSKFKLIHTSLLIR